MTNRRLPDELQTILTLNEDRITRAKRIAEAIREAGAYRWVGIYDVDVRQGTVSNIAWSGRNAPAYLVFPSWDTLMTTLINSKPPPEIEKQIWA